MDNSQTEIPKFWGEFFQKGLNKYGCGMFGIGTSYSPDSSQFKYSIAGYCQPDTKIPEGFEIIEIPENTWARNNFV